MSNTIKSAIDEAKAIVMSGRAIATVKSGAYEVRAQRTSWNNAKAPRIAIHVWHNDKLLPKSEWASP